MPTQASRALLVSSLAGAALFSAACNTLVTRANPQQLAGGKTAVVVVKQMAGMLPADQPPALKIVDGVRPAQEGRRAWRRRAREVTASHRGHGPAGARGSIRPCRIRAAAGVSRGSGRDRDDAWDDVEGRARLSRLIRDGRIRFYVVDQPVPATFVRLAEELGGDAFH